MKKLFALLCVLAMLCMLCVPAFAYEGLNSLAIVGSGIPGVKEWDPADPAGDMNEVEPGVFVKELSVTAGTTMKIKFAGNDAWDDAFNFGSATLAAGTTADLTCGSGSQDMTLSISKDGTLKFTVNVNPMADGGAATVLVEGDCLGEAPVVSFDSFYVAGQTGLVGQEWVADGAKMDKTGDNKYELTFSNIAAGEYQFKVTAGTWDNNWGGDGPDGNYLITVAEQSDVTVYFDADAKAISVDIVPVATEPPVTEPSEEITEPSEEITEPSEEITEPSEEITEPSEEVTEPSEPVVEDGMITVYFDALNDWATVNLYYWGVDGAPSWPGVPMTDEDGDGWFEYKVPMMTNNIIVNDGTMQSVDLVMDGDADAWLIASGLEGGKITCDIFYENPGAAEDKNSTDLTEPTEPSVEPTEPSAEPTEPSTEATEPSTEATEPSAEPTKPSAEPTEPSTEATAGTDSTEGTTQADIDAQRAKNHKTALIVIGVSLLVIIGIACVMSIPKKIT